MNPKEPIYNHAYRPLPEMTPSVRRAKLWQPIETLVELISVNRICRILPKGFESEEREQEIEYRAKRSIEHDIMVNVYKQLETQFPDVPRSEIVFSAVTFEDRQTGGDGIASPPPDRQIIGRVIIYRKMLVLTAMVETDTEV